MWARGRMGVKRPSKIVQIRLSQDRRCKESVKSTDCGEGRAICGIGNNGCAGGLGSDRLMLIGGGMVSSGVSNAKGSPVGVD